MALSSYGVPVRATKSTVTSIFAGFAIIVCIYVGFLSKHAATKGTVFRVGASPATHPDLAHLTQYNLSSNFTYARRRIKSESFFGSRPTLTALDEPLFPPTQALQSSDLSMISITYHQKPLTLQVPSSTHSTNGAILSFGIATTIPRLKESVRQLQHWLAHSGSTLHVNVPPHPDIQTLESHMRDLGININVTTSYEPFQKRYFGLVETLYMNKQPTTKWLVLIDDDTFIPSLSSLLTHLKEKHDPELPQLISALSDDMEQIIKHGMIPYGGGGIFISLPLAQQLSKPPISFSCLETNKTEGDQILADCVIKHTPIRPTYDLDLHQMDLKGDVSGFFESGRKALSLHHWKSWFEVDMPSVAAVSKACGDEGILQRWKFKGKMEEPEEWILSNGFSIVRYPNGIHFDSAQMEKTFDGEIDRFEYALGPLRPGLRIDEEKISYRLAEASVLDNSVRQTYVHTTAGGVVDGVLELDWLFK